MSEKKSTLMQKVQRFGGAMFTPVLFLQSLELLWVSQLYLRIIWYLDLWQILRLPGTRSGISFIMEQTRYLNRCH